MSLSDDVCNSEISKMKKKIIQRNVPERVTYAEGTLKNISPPHHKTASRCCILEQFNNSKPLVQKSLNI
jgi:hypothetical protein